MAEEIQEALLCFLRDKGSHHGFQSFSILYGF